jgi:hypothetical protein
MLSQSKPLAALAAITGALAIAVPAASANATTTTGPTADPQVCQLLNSTMGVLGPMPFLEGTALQQVLANAGSTVNCPAQTPPSPPPPAGP